MPSIAFDVPVTLKLLMIVSSEMLCHAERIQVHTSLGGALFSRPVGVVA